MKIYKEIVQDILTNGRLVNNRTKTKTYSSFGKQYRYNLLEGFPILTTRYQPFDKIVGETLWFLKGDSNCNYLDDNNIKLWKAWTDPTTNSIGPMYPTMLRKRPCYRTTPKEGYNLIHDNLYYKEVDQFMECLNSIKNNPDSRRHIIDLWNMSHLPDETQDPITNVQLGNTALAMCHVFSQFHVGQLSFREALELPINEHVKTNLMYKYGKDFYNKLNTLTPTQLEEYGEIKRKTLSLSMYQRSWDVGAAGGWNVTQYALLLSIMANMTGLIPYEFIHSIGDIHIYEDQIPALSLQLERTPYKSPTLVIKENDYKDPSEFNISDFKLIDYLYHSSIKIPVST